MDNVLTRKLFKDNYLKSINKNISNFKEGGLASLKAKRFSLGGMNVTGFSPEEKQALILGSLAVPLLEGKQAPGQSPASALLSNLGVGGSQAINTALQAKKLDIEAGSKGVPALKPAIDTVTGKPVFMTDQQLYLDQQSNKPRYEPPAGDIERQVQTTLALEKAKDTVKQQDEARRAVEKAGDVGILANNLIDNINKKESVSGKLGDVALEFEGLKGTVAQILNRDQQTNPAKYNEDYNMVKSAIDEYGKGKLYSPTATQEQKTMLTNLAYSIASAREKGGKLSDRDVKNALDTLGKSGSKEVMIAGLNQTVKDIVEPALRSYTIAHNTNEQKMLEGPYAHVVKLKNKFSPISEDQTQPQVKSGAKGVDPFSPSNW
jgi:hypothetical protein